MIPGNFLTLSAIDAMISISRLPLDFKETFGQNEAKKEEFCDSQKDQVQK